MSDSKFEYIDDVLLNVDKDKIEKKKKSRVKILRKIVKFQKNLQQKRKRKLLVKMRRKRPIRRRK